MNTRHVLIWKVLKLNERIFFFNWILFIFLTKVHVVSARFMFTVVEEEEVSSFFKLILNVLFIVVFIFILEIYFLLFRTILILFIAFFLSFSLRLLIFELCLFIFLKKLSFTERMFIFNLFNFICMHVHVYIMKN